MAVFLSSENTIPASDLVEFSGWIGLWDNWSGEFLARQKSRRGNRAAKQVFNGAAIVWFKNDGHGGSKIVAFFDMRNKVRVWDDVLWEPVRG